MKKYKRIDLEVIAFDEHDVITNSDVETPGYGTGEYNVEE